MTAVGHPDPNRLASRVHRTDPRTAHPPALPGTMITRPQKLIPVAGSAPKVDRTPADLTRPLDYPCEALCLECGEPVRCERWFTGTWVHIERFSNLGSKEA